MNEHRDVMNSLPRHAHENGDLGETTVSAHIRAMAVASLVLLVGLAISDSVPFHRLASAVAPAQASQTAAVMASSISSGALGVLYGVGWGAVNLSRLAVGADLAFSYGVAVAAPASARATISLISHTGTVLEYGAAKGAAAVFGAAGVTAMSVQKVP